MNKYLSLAGWACGQEKPYLNSKLNSSSLEWCVIDAVVACYERNLKVLTTIFLSYNFKLHIGSAPSEAPPAQLQPPRKREIICITARVRCRIINSPVGRYSMSASVRIPVLQHHSWVMRHRGVAVLKVKQWSYTYAVSFIALNEKLELISILNTASHIPNLWTNVRYSPVFAAHTICHVYYIMPHTLLVFLCSSHR